MAPLLAAGAKALIVIGLACGPSACSRAPSAHAGPRTPERDAAPAPHAATPSEDDARFARDRARMVDEQLAARDIRDEAVLAAMRKVPRHEFVGEAMRKY